MPELQEGTLIVFVSDSHIGGDPGCDGFESPAEMEELFSELGRHDGPVELILAGDFFDFLQIGSVPEHTDRAETTVSRPEYRELFAALRRFREGEEKRVVYMPGNHDAEMWWNTSIKDTLRERGLVDEFARSYLASMEVGGEKRIIYCEHGNQFDPPNTVEDYQDPLDTPLGHHVVTDFTRRIAPFGEVSPGLDLSEIKMVYPLVAIPQWIASRYFYDFLGKSISYLLMPLLVVYLIYRLLAHFLIASNGDPSRFARVYQELPLAHWFFVEITGFGAIILLIFAIFFLIIRRAVRRALARLDLHQRPRLTPAEASREKIRAAIDGKIPLPMSHLRDPEEIDVFVSGHTHLPSLDEMEKPNGGRRIMVNSGCWLRQLQPVLPRLTRLPVFVSKFVLTHVRVYAQGSELRVELWEHPKPAEHHLTRIERLLSWERRPPQPPPDAKPRVRAFSSV